uniref:Cytochrome b561 domain-containing protein n=1 Tax=Ascaris lumbricoides TaxID=6252 RepID=A0A0M3IIR6_ASCLU
MMQMAFIFLNGCRNNSILLLRAHAFLTLFYAIVTLVICVALSFCHLFNVGIFQYSQQRRYLQSHIIFGLCSLVPFIIGHRASTIRANQLRQYLLANERINSIS